MIDMTRRMHGIVLVALVALAASAARADLLTYQTVVVGNPGNANDSTGYGAVGYLYEIGKYDVTIGQYTVFLNAVAKTDTYGLYNTNMGTNLNVAGITRSGASGAYTYSVMNNGGASANRPITYVSWFDAARFANWMANGQPTGAQNATTTEDGAYALNGATSGNAPAKNAINPNSGRGPALWVPTENEWYKAAYYQPQAAGGPSDNYWSFATRSDSAPGNTVGSSANQANYYVGVYPNGSYALGGGVYSTSQNYLTDVGAFTGSQGFYGTFDQSGLVYQWNDLSGASAATRGVRGSDWSYYGGSFDLSSSYRNTMTTSNETYYVGFRLAAVPEPSTWSMTLLGCACLAWRVARRRSALV